MTESPKGASGSEISEEQELLESIPPAKKPKRSDTEMTEQRDAMPETSDNSVYKLLHS